MTILEKEHLPQHIGLKQTLWFILVAILVGGQTKQISSRLQIIGFNVNMRWHVHSKQQS